MTTNYLQINFLTNLIVHRPTYYTQLFNHIEDSIGWNNESQVNSYIRSELMTAFNYSDVMIDTVITELASVSRIPVAYYLEWVLFEADFDALFRKMIAIK